MGGGCLPNKEEGRIGRWVKDKGQPRLVSVGWVVEVVVVDGRRGGRRGER